MDWAKETHRDQPQLQADCPPLQDWYEKIGVAVPKVGRPLQCLVTAFM